MCVKEFLGYTCGHCSVPILRQCPLSASNPIFPVCKYSAERPIFTNDYCHPCSRVVWNAKVLKEEDEHRARHLKRECFCEVIFEGESREKRVRPRGNEKVKDAGNSRELIREEHGGSGAAKRELGNYVEESCDVEGHEEHDNVEINAVTKVEDSSSPQDSKLNDQIAAYEYVGYYVGTEQSRRTDPEQFYGTAIGGYDQQSLLSMGKSGAGMKWYPSENSPQIIRLSSAIETATTAIHHHQVFEEAPKVLRTTSEPMEKPEEILPVKEIESSVGVSQPLVVSSNMVKFEPSWKYFNCTNTEKAASV